MDSGQRRAFLKSLFSAAEAAADPALVVATNLPPRPAGRTVVVGAGKEAAFMAKALEAVWDGPLGGVVVAPYGSGVGCRRIRVLEAAHPVPDEAGLRATVAILDAVEGLKEDDLVIALISGGGSALLPSPPDGMTLRDEVDAHLALLESDASVGEINVVRKHLSNIKGGRLAIAAFPAKVVTLIVSDLPADDPCLVSSGPTVPDEATRQDAIDIVRHYGIQLPRAAKAQLAKVTADAPSMDDPRFVRNIVRVVASPRLSLDAAARFARENLVDPIILTDAFDGEAAEAAHIYAAMAKTLIPRARKRPVVILSAGQNFVRPSQKGMGMRNMSFLLSLSIDIKGQEKISAFAANSHGAQPSQTQAGAFVDGSTVSRLNANSIDVCSLLRDDEHWHAFEVLGDLVPVRRSVATSNDLRAVLVDATA